MRKKKLGRFGVEVRACGQKLVKFCTLTHAAKLVVEIYTYKRIILALSLTDGAGYWTLFALSLGFML